MGLSLLLLPFLLQAPTGSARDFDFWAGQWSVQNRHLQSDGHWQDGDLTRARITAVLDGAAMVEEWAGPFHGGFMNGFSLRSYDPKADLWTILLFWTTDGDASFGRMQGRFRHGRGTFLSPLQASPGQGNVLRYTFSDALANSVRWDSANSTDGGITWKTDWIMEFSRTAAAAACTEEALFTQPWNPGSLSLHPEARRLDWLRGHWEGVESDAQGVVREARLDVTLLDKDCLLLSQLAVRQAGEEDWHKSLDVRAFVAAHGRWESWHVSEEETSLQAGQEVESESGFRCRHDLGDGRVMVETLLMTSADELRWTVRVMDVEGVLLEAIQRQLQRSS